MSLIKKIKETKQNKTTKCLCADSFHEGSGISSCASGAAAAYFSCFYFES